MQAAPPTGDTEIIIGRGIPPEADFVFTSTNAEGTPGDLGRYVAEATNYGTFEFDSSLPSRGYALLQREGLPVIIAVVTVAPDAKPDELLWRNLQSALVAIAADIAGRSVWLPLMATGPGGLAPEQSFEITGRVLRESGFIERAAPQQLALSLGPDLDDDRTAGLFHLARKLFDQPVLILDTITGPEQTGSVAVGMSSPAGKADAPRALADIETPPIAIELTRDLVAQVQRALSQSSAETITADGFMGPATRFAIEAFQSANGIEPTGRLDSTTIDRLRELFPEIGMPHIATPDDPGTSAGSTPPPPEQKKAKRARAGSAKKTATPKPRPPKSSDPDETAPFYPDHPAEQDALGREAIAEAIATIVHDAWSVSGERGSETIDRTFMVHIHGRWGSGKSSILNFLRDILRPNAKATRDAAGDNAPQDIATPPPWHRRVMQEGGLLLRDLPRLLRRKPPSDERDADETPDWIVVDYNAWRNQGHGPAAWSLLNRVYTEAYEQLGGLGDPAARELRYHDIKWRLRSGWTPYALAAATLIFIILLVTMFTGLALKEGLAAVGSVLAVIAGVFTFGKTYQIGSARSATTFLEMTRDPLRPLIHRYNDMIDEIGRPVAVFIDDLDRCDAAFVVELLQSVQTLYRHARVLYVVAADRDWICCSYEQVYDKFQNTIGEAGRPLGHLFLEKIFQLSISVPNMSGLARDEYWQRLVAGSLATDAAAAETIREKEKAAIGKLDTEAEIRDYTSQIQGDPVRRRIAGAQAFSRLQTARLRTEREHFLTRYARLIEPNPRAMKRLVNAYGFKRGFELMSGSATDADALVRWTILELRWPMLASHLSRNPDDIELGADTAAVSENNTIRLLAETPVRRITADLTPTDIRILVGDGAIEEDNQPAAA